MEAISCPWAFTSAGRLVTAIGKRVKDGAFVYVDSTGSWCKANGEYQVPGEPRPLQSAALLDKKLEVPASLYNFLLTATNDALHVKLPNGAVLVPLLEVTPSNGPLVFLSPKGKVVNELGLTSVTWKKHQRGLAPPRLKPLPNSIGASRLGTLGCVSLRQTTIMASPTKVTVRELQAAYGRKRSRS